MELTQKSKEIILIASQQKELDEMVAWSYRPALDEDLFYVLCGYAGTGKTTILKEFIKKNKYASFDIAITAPTHKAKKKAEQATGLSGVTIQKALGLRPNTNIDNFNINRPEFSEQAEPEIGKHGLVIIDEASMFNKALFERLIELAKLKKTKLLFVGDEKQLPPVNETESLAITSIANRSNLTEIIRQRDVNPLGELLNLLREDIEKGTTDSLEKITGTATFTDEEGEEHGYEVITDRDLFREKVLTAFSDERYIFNKEFCKYLAWTNDSVKAMNRIIRDHIIKSDMPIAKGDLVMGYSTIYNKSGDIMLTNSEEYIVTRVNDFENSWDVNGYLVDIKAVDTPFSNTVFVANPNDLDKFLEIFEERHSKALKFNSQWNNFYLFKNDNLLIQDIKNGNKIKVKKDLDFAYGLTVHKSQGSTYENVFINLVDIKRGLNFGNSDRERRISRDTTMRLIYVALSRASKKCIILA